MQKSPHMLIEGMIIAAYAVGANRAFIFIRGEYELQAEILERAVAGGRRGRLPRRAHPRLGPQPHAVGAPRRGRLHLRRGDRAARLARGPARQPAAQAAVPRQPGPLPGARRSSTTSRRWPPSRTSSGWAARSTPRSARPTPRARSSSRCRATCSARATTRSSWASRRARSSTAWPAGRRRAARSSSGSRAARARPCSPPTSSTCPTRSTRWPRRARCSAPARSSSSTTRTPWSTSP